MAARHREFIAELRNTLAYARGAARAAITTAEDRVRQARAELDEARQNYQRAEQLLRLQHAERLATVTRRCAADLARSAAVFGELAAEQAPGAAGTAPWAGWQPTDPGRGRLPGLYRIGRLRVGPDTPVGAEHTAGPDAAPTPGELIGDAAPPALVSLLDQSHLLVHNSTGHATDIPAVVSTVLLRVLGSTPPGSVRLTVYDPEQLGGSLASFAPLASAGLLNFVGPGGLGSVLDELVEQIRRINQTVLAGEYRSLRELAARTGRRPEPWRVAVLLGGPGHEELSTGQRAQLDRIIRTGPACGVHLVASGLDPVEERRDHPAVESVVLFAEGAWTSLTGDTFPVELDPAPTAELITGTCRAIAERVAAGPEPAVFDDLLPDELWTESSAHRLVAPIGEGTDGRLVEAELGDAPPHALIGGPSGSGKTNLLYAWIGALAARYSPDDLELYLLDFKEGVSFARLAPGRRDPTWLPHVRLVGVNVNSDREYGLALLTFLQDKLRERAEAAKAHEATKLSELRAEDPTGRWPRIVAIIDEFQVMLDGRDALTNEAARLLEDLARRGRSQGIHLVLASQDVSGIQALWGRPALVSQFTLRIALPKARKILAPENTAGDMVPRHHAVVNPDSGVEGANQIAHIPDAGSRGTLDVLQTRLWRLRPADLPEPILFDGDRVPRLAAATDFAALAPPPAEAPTAPVALLGQNIDVAGRSATLRLTRSPGRNLAVLGTRSAEACHVLTAAALSLARQHRPGTARFSLACLDDDAVDTTKQLLDRLRAAGHDAGWHDRDGFRGLLEEAAGEVRSGQHDGTERRVPHYLVLYAVDAVSTQLARKPPRPGSPSGRDNLGELIHRGPELSTHVLGWWRSVPRLRDDLGGVGARLDGVGAWLALDIQGTELAPLSPEPKGPLWYPRVRRALYFDRSVHRHAHVIIPYDTTGGLS